ncbi:MAG: hypothetical protein IJ725_02840 [Ruminococcus sp.]|nr:hypothetical protein [Ruminococcus sp.]
MIKNVVGESKKEIVTLILEAVAVAISLIQKVREAGKQYAKNGIISKDLMKEIISPMIPENQYAEIVNSSV